MNTFKVGAREVTLNSDILKFNIQNINEFLENFASLYDYYSELHALALAEYDYCQAEFEQLRDVRFVETKNLGKSDKFADAYSCSIDEVIARQEKMIGSKYKEKRLQGWLKSMVYAFDSAREYCFNLRKEMDKIHGARISSAH